MLLALIMMLEKKNKVYIDILMMILMYEVCLKSSVSENNQNRRCKQIIFIGHQNIPYLSKLLETLSKEIFRNGSQDRCDMFLGCCHVFKICAFYDAFQAEKWKEVRGCHIRGVRWRIENRYSTSLILSRVFPVTTAFEPIVNIFSTNCIRPVPSHQNFISVAIFPNL